MVNFDIPKTSSKIKNKTMGKIREILKFMRLSFYFQKTFLSTLNAELGPETWNMIEQADWGLFILKLWLIKIHYKSLQL